MHVSEKIPGTTYLLVVGIAVLLIFSSASMCLAQLVDTDHNLTFFWEKPQNDNDVIRYVVQYSIDSGNTWSAADTVPASVDPTTYYTLQLEQDAIIVLRVSAVDVAGHEGPHSQQSSPVISDTAPPGAPGQPEYVDEGSQPQANGAGAAPSRGTPKRFKS